jgi:hypothetical protein
MPKYVTISQIDEAAVRMCQTDRIAQDDVKGGIQIRWRVHERPQNLSDARPLGQVVRLVEAHFATVAAPTAPAHEG